MIAAEMTSSSGLVLFFVRKNRSGGHAYTYISRKESCVIVHVERKDADDIQQKNVGKVGEIPRVQVKSVRGLNETSG